MSRLISYFGDKEARILVLGLDNAGKTTILCEQKSSSSTLLTSLSSLHLPESKVVIVIPLMSCSLCVQIDCKLGKSSAPSQVSASIGWQTCLLLALMLHAHPVSTEKDRLKWHRSSAPAVTATTVCMYPTFSISPTPKQMLLGHITFQTCVCIA